MNASICYILLVSLSLLSSAASKDSLSMVDQEATHLKRALESTFSDVQTTDFDLDVEKLMAELNFRTMLHQLKKKLGKDVLKESKEESVREEKSAKRGRTFFIGRK